MLQKLKPYPHRYCTCSTCDIQKECKYAFAYEQKEDLFLLSSNCRKILNKTEYLIKDWYKMCGMDYGC